MPPPLGSLLRGGGWGGGEREGAEMRLGARESDVAQFQWGMKVAPCACRVGSGQLDKADV